MLEDRRLLSNFLVTNTNDSGPGSLRQAILDANGNAGLDTIAFAIDSGHQVIAPAATLPIVTDPVVIDGDTQPGFSGTPLIELNGSSVTNPGLWIAAGGSTVRGLAINRFHGNGIQLDGSGGNLITGNYIGTDWTGTSALGNTGAGVAVSGPGNVIGGLVAGDRNVISGNGGTAVNLQGPTVTGNLVLGNFLGTNAAGTAALANGGAGVFLGDSASGNTIGGTDPGAGNLISGNQGGGVGINGYGGPISGNVIQGNLIGTDWTGTAKLGNGGDGVGIGIGASNNLVGGTATQARNVISGNKGNGIRLSNDGTTGNLVQGNFIGTDASGTAALGNDQVGVYIDGAPGNVIGGATAGAGNVISANGADGVNIAYFGTAAGNVVQGNLIGLNASGTAALGNQGTGVVISAPNTTIGGTTPEGRNVISANGKNGVWVVGPQATGIVVAGNFIGVAADGSAPLGNTADGVNILAASGNTIGGTDPGAGNFIAFNGGDGVRVDAGTGNAIQQNSIFGHDAGLGIELVNGGNQSQPAPLLTGAASGGGVTTVAGTLSSTPNTAYALEFFATPVTNPSGYGEGLVFLGSLSVTTDNSGGADFTAVFAGEVPPGWFIAATATDPGNNTSAFSACVPVSGAAFAGLLRGIRTFETGSSSGKRFRVGEVAAGAVAHRSRLAAGLALRPGVGGGFLAMAAEGPTPGRQSLPADFLDSPSVGADGGTVQIG
jgi:titin